MKIIESTSLSPRRAIYLIQVDGQTYMVGATDQSVNLISEVESLEIGENVKPPLFSEVLTKAGDLLE
jgi:flagellar biogenesis protein FliO